MKRESLSIERKCLLFDQILNNYKSNVLITRKGLTEINGFRPATVTLLITELIELGVVKEDTKTNVSGPGRPEVCLVPNLDQFNAIFIYVDSRTFIASLVNLAGEILTTIHEEIADKYATKKEITEVILRLSKTLIDSTPSNFSICGMTLSLPGIVDRKNQIWKYSNRWPQAKEIFFEEIQDALNLEINIVKNLQSELNAFVLENNKLDSQRVLYIHWGEGVGAASYAPKGLSRFNDGLFSELGQTLVDSQGTTLEQATSLASLRQQLNDILGQMPINEKHCASLLTNQPIESMPSVKNAVSIFSRALVNAYLTLFPNTIILTGPFVQNKQIFQLLKEQFFKQLPDYCGTEIEFQINSNSFQNELNGAMYPFFNKHLKNLITST